MLRDPEYEWPDTWSASVARYRRDFGRVFAAAARAGIVTPGFHGSLREDCATEPAVDPDHDASCRVVRILEPIIVANSFEKDNKSSQRASAGRLDGRPRLHRASIHYEFAFNCFNLFASSSCSRRFFVIAMARWNSSRASECLPIFISRSPRTLGKRW